MTEFDVVIVGSGAGGSISAYSLTRQGYKVCLIERGRRFNPSVDYIQNYSDWDMRKDPLNEANSNEQTIDQTYLTSTGALGNNLRRKPFVYQRVYGLGGTTLHYQGEAHRFAKHAFKTKTLFGTGVDWPIGYQDLESYYAQVEKLLGVAGHIGNPFKPTRESFPTPGHPLTEKSVILAKSARKIGMSLLPNTLALPSKSLDGRIPCQHSGGCVYGCIFGAKSSADQAIIPLAEKTENLTILTDTRALKLGINSLGQVNSVHCQNKNKKFTVKGKRIILAMGAIETPRLLLHSKHEKHLRGIGNQFDQVGRYFMETITTWLPIKLTQPIQTYRGPPIESRVWDYCKPIDNKTNGFVLGLTGFLTHFYGPTKYALRTRGIGRAHKKRVKEGFGRQLWLFGVTEQDPSFNNRLLLSSNLDDKGVPKVNVRCIYSERDVNTIQVMDQKLKAWAKATGVRKIGKSTNTFRKPSATHIAGSCRMGNNAEKSVVDSYGKVYGQDYLYITDASIMPTQGVGDSPSLTIQALALRCAEKIGRSLRA